MEVNLSGKVKALCRKQGISLKDLALRMGIAPESLSRAINGNPQLSTLEGIAANLQVSVGELFYEEENAPHIVHSKSDNPQSTPLHSIIVHKGCTYIADDIEALKLNVQQIIEREGQGD